MQKTGFGDRWRYWLVFWVFVVSFPIKSVPKGVFLPDSRGITFFKSYFHNCLGCSWLVARVFKREILLMGVKYGMGYL